MTISFLFQTMPVLLLLENTRRDWLIFLFRYKHLYNISLHSQHELILIDYFQPLYIVYCLSIIETFQILKSEAETVIVSR